MSTQSAPKPTFTVEISVGGCEWERVAEELIRAAEHVRECGTACNRVWGGAGTHGHVHIVQRDVTEAQYSEELDSWWQAQKTTTRAGAGEGR